MTVDELAQEIRRVDGDHENRLGAGALAEALMPFIERRASPSDAVARDLLADIRDHIDDPEYVRLLRPEIDSALSPPPSASPGTVTEPVEWRYLFHGKGNWKHVYNSAAAKVLYDENKTLPANKRHVIDPLYTEPQSASLVTSQSVPAVLPLAKGRSKESGWTLDPTYLGEVNERILSETGYDATKEVIEAALLIGNRALPLPATAHDGVREGVLEEAAKVALKQADTFRKAGQDRDAVGDYTGGAALNNRGKGAMYAAKAIRALASPVQETRE